MRLNRCLNKWHYCGANRLDKSSDQDYCLGVRHAGFLMPLVYIILLVRTLYCDPHYEGESPTPHVFPIAALDRRPRLTLSCG